MDSPSSSPYSRFNGVVPGQPPSDEKAIFTAGSSVRAPSYHCRESSLFTRYPLLGSADEPKCQGYARTSQPATGSSRQGVRCSTSNAWIDRARSIRHRWDREQEVPADACGQTAHHGCGSKYRDRPGEGRPQSNASVQPRLDAHDCFQAVVGLSMSAGPWLLSLWLLSRPGSPEERSLSRKLAALLPVLSWSPFFIAVAVPGTRGEDAPGVLARVAGVPINLFMPGLVPSLAFDLTEAATHFAGSHSAPQPPSSAQ